jgi:hypothetical protein
LIAGFAHGWETQDYGEGSCDFNFLTGKGVSSRGLAKSKPVREKLTPLRLVGWSAEKQPKPCR